MARKIVYKGIDVEQVPKLSWEEFMRLIPSNSRRTLKRMGSQVKKFLEKLRKHDFSKKPMKTHFRNMPVTPDMVGKTFLVYNGHLFTEVKASASMLGRRLGDYAITIKLVKHSGPGVGATRGSKTVELK
ncbi:MAG: ribosomal protein S19 family protein [Candidatus Micrarchaeota archaeon]